MPKKAPLRVALLLGLLLPLQVVGQVHIKVMTFNIKSAEPDFIAQPYIDLIKKYKPDVVSLQEVEVYTSRVGQKSIVMEIAAAVGMFPLFAPAYQKDIGKYGVALLSRFPYSQMHYSPLPKLGSDPRVALFARAVLPTGDELMLVAVHLDHTTTDVQKMEEARQLYDRALFDAGIPVVLAGDFNMHHESGTALEIGKHYDRMCSNAATYEMFSKLDYIFAAPKGKWRLVQTSVLYETGSLSDHYPVLSEIELLP